jgi:hypothetical protein
MVAMNLDLIISTPPEVIVALTKATGARAPTQNDETNSLGGWSNYVENCCPKLFLLTINVKPSDSRRHLSN